MSENAQNIPMPFFVETTAMNKDTGLSNAAMLSIAGNTMPSLNGASDELMRYLLNNPDNFETLIKRLEGLGGIETSNEISNMLRENQAIQASNPNTIFFNEVEQAKIAQLLKATKDLSF